MPKGKSRKDSKRGENQKTHTSNPGIRVGIPCHESTLAGTLEMDDGKVLAVVFAGLLNCRDSQLQPDETECLAGRDGVALLRQRDVLGFEIEAIKIVVVQEADNARPRARHAVWIKGVQLGVKDRCDGGSNETAYLVQGLRHETSLGDALEWLIP